MFEMSSHDPFGHLKHKLWPKERLGIKLPIYPVERMMKVLKGYVCSMARP
jgi:hypothetical protein